MRRGLIAFLLLFLLAAAPQAAVNCRRVVAVGDLHGGYEAFSEILDAAGLVDENDEWLDRGSCLVQTGDIVDRGARSRELLDRMMRLQRANPGQFHVLLGNHEVMVMLGQTRDSAPGEFAAFAADETPAMRERAFEEFRRFPAVAELRTRAARAAFDERYPHGWFARRAAFAPSGHYGKWLLKRPLLLRIDDSLFVHGGIEIEDARRGIDALNKQVVRALRDYHRLRRNLERRGEMSILTSYADSYEVARWTVARQGDPTLLVRDTAALRAARGLLALEDEIFADPAGPLWTRRLAREDEESYRPELQQILQLLGVKRIAVGHTVNREFRIKRRFDGRVFLLDTGAGPHYGGRASALEITRQGQVSAIYLDGRKFLDDEPSSAGDAAAKDYRRPEGMTDAELEDYLLEAEVIRETKIDVGVTHPKQLVLQRGGLRLRAAFKAIDLSKQTATASRNGPPELNFTDRHVYERAAYLLDRELGIGMVPVAVLREWNGKKGVFVQWIEDAIDEGDRVRSDRGPENRLYLQYQKHVMNMFDALILNTDRTPGNQLITPHDWKLHMIDHSRAFRLARRVPDLLERTGLTIPREQYEALRQLNEPRLVELLGELLTRSQIRALLARRDILVARFDRDLAARGEEAVFQELIPAAHSAVLEQREAGEY